MVSQTCIFNSTVLYVERNETQTPQPITSLKKVCASARLTFGLVLRRPRHQNCTCYHLRVCHFDTQQASQWLLRISIHLIGLVCSYFDPDNQLLYDLNCSKKQRRSPARTSRKHRSRHTSTSRKLTWARLQELSISTGTSTATITEKQHLGLLFNPLDLPHHHTTVRWQTLPQAKMQNCKEITDSSWMFQW